MYRGFGDVVGEQWLWYPERARDDAQCKPGRPATRDSAGIDRLAAAISLPPPDRADLFWGIGWHVRVEFPEARRRGLDWVGRLPVETRRDTMSGFEAAERWFGLAAERQARASDRLINALGDAPGALLSTRLTSATDPLYLWAITRR